MDIQTLTKKMNDFVRSKGWYEPGSPKAQTPRNLAISLSLETSEVLELFQWTDTCNNLVELESELADVSLYLLQLADVTGIDLEAAIEKKLNKNARREWKTQV
jgi:NTP pyrophosphatase (non-canonical NTP hydrolase)